MIQDTTIQAYDSIRTKLGEKQAAVRHLLLKYGPMSNETIAERLEWPINTVTPRLKELRDMGVVVEAGYEISRKTMRKVHLWKLKYEPRPKIIINATLPF